MKDGYRYRDGKVIVVDYDKNNNKSEEERDYQDNIEELLMAENIREYLYDYKNEINEFIDYNKKEISACIEVIAAIDIVLLFVGFLIGGVTTLIAPIVGKIIITIGILGLGGSTVFAIKYIKNRYKELAGANLALKGIEEELENNKINLRKLENDNRVDCENIKGRNYVQLNYVEELKRLREYLELWRVVGENEKKFSKYDEQDKLYIKLANDFKNEEITTLKRILNKNVKKY